MLSLFSRVWLFVTPWTIAHQAPLSMGFSRQEYWSGFPYPSPGNLTDPGIKATSPTSPALTLFTTSLTWEASQRCWICLLPSLWCWHHESLSLSLSLSLFLSLSLSLSIYIYIYISQITKLYTLVCEIFKISIVTSMNLLRNLQKQTKNTFQIIWYILFPSKRKQ